MRGANSHPPCVHILRGQNAFTAVNARLRWPSLTLFSLMLSTLRVVTLGITLALSCGCAGFVDRYFPPLIRPEEIAEIKVAIRKITSSPVKYCTRPSDDSGPRPEIYVWTEDGKSYRCEIRGKWYFHEVVLVGSLPHLTVRWSERLAALVPYFP